MIFKIIVFYIEILKYSKNIKYIVVNMEKEKMPNVTISLTKEEKKMFDMICQAETRGPSDQFRHMMKFYQEYKDKVK